MGGRRHGKDWLSNPQYRLTVESDAPVSVSITLVQNSASTLGVFALDVRRNHEDQVKALGAELRSGSVF